EILRRVVDRALLQRRAHAHVHHDLFHARNLVDVGVLVLVLQRRHHFVDVFFVKSRLHIGRMILTGPIYSYCAGSAAASFPARASNTSAFIRFERWIVPSRSMIAPCGFCWLLRVWRLIIFRPSTIARNFFGLTEMILPRLPFSAPASTTT